MLLHRSTGVLEGWSVGRKKSNIFHAWLNTPALHNSGFKTATGNHKPTAQFLTTNNLDLHPIAGISGGRIAPPSV